jgi:hypothetical protein
MRKVPRFVLWMPTTVYNIPIELRGVEEGVFHIRWYDHHGCMCQRHYKQSTGLERELIRKKYRYLWYGVPQIWEEGKQNFLLFLGAKSQKNVRVERKYLIALTRPSFHSLIYLNLRQQGTELRTFQNYFLLSNLHYAFAHIGTYMEPVTESHFRVATLHYA